MQGHSISIAAAYHSPSCIHKQRFQATAIRYLQIPPAFQIMHIVPSTCSCLTTKIAPKSGKKRALTSALSVCACISMQHLVCSEDKPSANQNPSQLRQLQMQAEESCCKAQQA